MIPDPNVRRGEVEFVDGMWLATVTWGRDWTLDSITSEWSCPALAREFLESMGAEVITVKPSLYTYQQLVRELEEDVKEWKESARLWREDSTDAENMLERELKRATEQWKAEEAHGIDLYAELVKAQDDLDVYKMALAASEQRAYDKRDELRDSQSQTMKAHAAHAECIKRAEMQEMRLVNALSDIHALEEELYETSKLYMESQGSLGRQMARRCGTCEHFGVCEVSRAGWRMFHMQPFSCACWTKAKEPNDNV